MTSNCSVGRCWLKTERSVFSIDVTSFRQGMMTESVDDFVNINVDTASRSSPPGPERFLRTQKHAASTSTSHAPPRIDSACLRAFVRVDTVPFRAFYGVRTLERPPSASEPTPRDTE